MTNQRTSGIGKNAWGSFVCFAEFYASDDRIEQWRRSDHRQCDYEPFGNVLWQSGAPTRLGFIDKEKDKESALGDFGVRKYDDGIGRFTSIDPLWEKYRSLTPYQYGANNPLTIKDPSGKVLGVGIQNAWEEGEGNTPSRYDGVKQGDPPKGSSHLEESFKESVRNVAALPGAIVEGINSAVDGAIEMNREVARADIMKAQIITPDYVQVSFGGSEILSVGGTAAYNFTLINTGGRKAEVVQSISTGPGFGYDMGGSISFTMGWFIPSNGDLLDNSGVTVESLAGKGYNLNVGSALFGPWGFTAGISPAQGGQYNSYGITIGKSLSGPVTGSFTITDTKICK